MGDISCGKSRCSPALQNTGCGTLCLHRPPASEGACLTVVHIPVAPLSLSDNWEDQRSDRLRGGDGSRHRRETWPMVGPVASALPRDQRVLKHMPTQSAHA